MKIQKSNRSFDLFFTFLLLAAFALFALMLSAMGSAIYKNGIDHLNANYTSRTSIAYVTEQVRRHDRADSIVLTEINDIPALAFTETVHNESFSTYIYYYDGSLRELFIRTGADPSPDLGSIIVEPSSFTMEACGLGLLRITAADDQEKCVSAILTINSTQKEGGR